MNIQIKVVTTRTLLRHYIYLPSRISTRPNWVPPIYLDEWAFHNHRKNPALAHSEVIRFLAMQDDKPVGRIMGIINKKYNERCGLKNANFFNLECINSAAVAHALITATEAWASERGMTKMVGPYGFSDKDPQGLQVEGFEHLPAIATPTNAPYLQKLVEEEGYSKELDCISYQFQVPHQVPDVYHKVADRVRGNPNVKLIEFRKKSQLKPYIVPVLRLVNETYAHLFGFVPMTEPEMKSLAAQYLFVLDPEFVKVVINKAGEVMAFGIGLPDISAGIQRAKGKLFPFGLFHILRASKKATQLDLMLGAVKPSARAIGLNAILATSMITSAIRRKIKFMDSHLILESNRQMRAEFERAGSRIYKRYRVYQKTI